MSKKVAGTCYIKADGEQLEVAGGVAVPMSDTVRETVMADAGPAGYSEKAVAPYVKLSAVVGANFPLQKLRTATNMTVTVELANGMAVLFALAMLNLIGACALFIHQLRISSRQLQRIGLSR